MTKAELIAILRKCAKSGDHVTAHIDADAALLAFIDDPDVTALYMGLTRWYE